MLIELKVKDFAIIQSIHIQFQAGLNILSGETGAGKSILMKSLSLLMGGKASSDIVRTGAKQAIIEGCFDISERNDIKKQLEEMGIDHSDDQLIVRRIISSQAKSRVYINSSLNTINSLSQVVSPLIQLTGNSAPLVEITGQHESKNLMSKSYQLDLLDQYADTLIQRSQFSKIFDQLRTMEKDLEALKNESLLRAQKLDYLYFQKKEIEELDLVENEDQTLEESYIKLKNAHKINEFISNSEHILVSGEGSALERIQKTLSWAEKIYKYDESIIQKMEELKTSANLIEDSMLELQKYIDELPSDNYELDRIEDRLTKLRRLQKKYGSSVNQILQSYSEIKVEISELEGSDEKINDLNKMIKVFHLEAKALSNELSISRKKAALKFSKAVNKELMDLNMKGLEFLIQVDSLNNLNSTGENEVNFLCKNSKDDKARALAKTASGGELSRILLSLKQVIGKSELPRTYIFDEVDTGVSGPTAEKVGKKLKQIAEGQQVICVTHLAQVACYGDVHFLIEKNNKKDSTQMHLSELNSDNRINEIARLISGEKISKTSIEHAKELLSH